MNILQAIKAWANDLREVFIDLDKEVTDLYFEVFSNDKRVLRHPMLNVMELFEYMVYYGLQKIREKLFFDGKEEKQSAILTYTVAKLYRRGLERIRKHSVDEFKLKYVDMLNEKKTRNMSDEDYSMCKFILTKLLDTTFKKDKASIEKLTLLL